MILDITFIVYLPGITPGPQLSFSSSWYFMNLEFSLMGWHACKGMLTFGAGRGKVLCYEVKYRLVYEKCVYISLELSKHAGLFLQDQKWGFTNKFSSFIRPESIPHQWIRCGLLILTKRASIDSLMDASAFLCWDPTVQRFGCFCLIDDVGHSVRTYFPSRFL